MPTSLFSLFTSLVSITGFYSKDEPVFWFSFLQEKKYISANSNSNRIVEMFYVNWALSGLVLILLSTHLRGASKFIVTPTGLGASSLKVSFTADMLC